ncbi:MAG TPA: hypothetical protein PKM27_05715 [Saprospiraceae bacterium]|nr:hypothetical protein [Saprospiraceae bacterium]HNT19959.1 hypothetical protein [Saprospiraceae bacterium]
MKKRKWVVNGYPLNLTRDIRFWFWLICMLAFLLTTISRIVN